MLSSAFHTALKAFGGWPGLCAFYFVGLAFPFCYALRTLQVHSHQDIRRQSNELRLASFVVFLSATLCLTYPADVYLQRHVPAHSHLRARILDWTCGLVVAYVLGPVLGFARLRRTTIADRDQMLVDLGEARPMSWDLKARDLVSTLRAQWLAESTWLLLFTLWFMNMAGGLLTVCIGNAIRHDIAWWQLPLCNIGAHVALLHAMVGVVEALFHPFRIEVMEQAMGCESNEARAAYWAWVLDRMGVRYMLGRMVLARESLQVRDIEAGIGNDVRCIGMVSEQVCTFGLVADEKVPLQSDGDRRVEEAGENHNNDLI